MPNGREAGAVLESEAAVREAQREERRCYMRRYMRRWRADAAHRAKERASQQRLYYEQKARQGAADGGRPPFTDAAGQRVCGFCHRREPVRDVVRLQACESVPVGFVLGGAPVRYGEIEEETGFNIRTLERWMAVLRRYGYIETETAPGGVVIRITKAKKFPQGVRKNAESVRTFAYGTPQKCVRTLSQDVLPVRDAPPMGSSSVERFPDEPAQAAAEHFTRHEHGCAKQAKIPSWEEENRGAGESASGLRARMAAANAGHNAFADWRREKELRRAACDDAVRRELDVGSGPEVRRS